MYGQGSGHADDDRVSLRKAFDVCGGLEAAGSDEFRDPIRRHVLDVADAVVELLDLGWIDVEAENLEPNFAEAEHERQADVTQAHNTDGVVATRDALLQQVQVRHALASPPSLDYRSFRLRSFPCRPSLHL